MFQKNEHICDSIPEPSQNEIHALENEDIYESDSEEDGDPEYSFDSMEDNEFPMDQLLMILLKHFYRGGIFIVGDLNMRLSSDEESVNADLFKKLRCDDSEAIEKVSELDFNTRAPLKDVGNFKVDYPYALPPSYDFGNFQMKSILSGVDGDDSKKRSVCMCNDAGGHLFSRWRRNDCGSSSSSLPSSPDFLKSFVVPQEFYLTLPTYITRDSATSSNWRNSLSKVQTFRRTSSNREWIEVSRNGETLDESDRCDVRCEGNSNYADNDVAVLIHDDTLTPGDSVFKIGYLDRMAIDDSSRSYSENRRNSTELTSWRRSRCNCIRTQDRISCFRGKSCQRLGCVRERSSSKKILGFVFEFSRLFINLLLKNSDNDGSADDGRIVVVVWIVV